MKGPEITRTLIKICGLCRPEDARAAVAAGADLVGVILAPSKRRLDLDQAASVLADVPAGVSRVGVFVDAAAAEVAEAAERLSLDYAQFHGSETPGACAEAPVAVIKAFGVGRGFDTGTLDAYRGSVAAVMLDTAVAGVSGGTGAAFDWDEVAPLPGFAPVFVAGGLGPGNVGQAVRTLRPTGVDVSSGVEASVCRKDPDAIRAFIAAVRAVDEECEVR